jgi:hypothetical protein
LTDAARIRGKQPAGQLLNCRLLLGCHRDMLNMNVDRRERLTIVFPAVN